MKWLVPSLLCVALGACGPSIADSEDEVLREAIWSVGPATTRGPMTAVCIPMLDQDACLRVTMVMDASAEPSHVGGSIVGPDCTPHGPADTQLEDFDGTAYTAHGMLWMTGSAQLDDQSRLDLDVEAVLGECEI